MARPMPEVVPVITAILPANRMCVSCFVLAQPAAGVADALMASHVTSHWLASDYTVEDSDRSDEDARWK